MMTDDIDYFSISILAIWIFFWMKYPFKFLPHVSIDLSIFFLLTYNGSLYILDMTIGNTYCNNFFHSVVYLYSVNGEF